MIAADEATWRIHCESCSGIASIPEVTGLTPDALRSFMDQRRDQRDVSQSYTQEGSGTFLNK